MNTRYLGDTESTIRALFAAARRCAPCVVFFDEVDAIACKRGASNVGSTGVEERVLSQLLNEIDGVQDSRGVFVLGCTNLALDEMDPAILRPGRLEVHLEVAAPGDGDRTAVVQQCASALLRSWPWQSLGEAPAQFPTDVAARVVQQTAGASVAEIVGVFQHIAVFSSPPARAAGGLGAGAEVERGLKAGGLAAAVDEALLELRARAALKPC